MTSANDESPIEEVSTQDLILDASNEILKEFEDVKEYNKNINTHDPYYTNCVPNFDILIRVHRRLPVITESGLILNVPEASDFGATTKVAGSGQTYSLPEKESQFKFARTAVIVALSKHYQEKYKVGQVVNIGQIPIFSHKIEQTEYHEYQYQFVSPESGFSTPPADCTNPHYGYALVPDSLIIAWQK